MGCRLMVKVSFLACGQFLKRERVMSWLGAGAKHPLKAASYKSLSVDLEERGWSNKLMASGGFNPDLPSVWIAEGLVMYISEEGVDNLLREVHAVAAKGSRLLLMVRCFGLWLGAACSSIPRNLCLSLFERCWEERDQFDHSAPGLAAYWGGPRHAWLYHLWP